MSTYWHWEKALPKEVCEIMLKEISSMQLELASITHNNNGAIDTEQRNNKVVFLPNNHWVEGILLNYARYANSFAGWNFSLGGNEPIQVTSYREGEKYEWHRDSEITDKSKPYQRKVTVVCQLSDANDFTGGGLFINHGDKSILKNQGDIAAFPAFMLHKAAEVTSGHRITLVCWVTGECFR